MTDAPTTRTASAGRPRATVTAVVVTRGATEYLEQTLTALLAQSRTPSRLLLVDVGHPEEHAHRHGEVEPDPEVGALLDRLRATAPPVEVDLVHAPRARTFGAAVKAGLRGWSQQVPDSWLWLLHDDSAPAPDALATLVRAVEMAPSVVVAGCKQRSWSGPVRVLEAGFTTSRFGRRMTGIDEPEVDQGQHDSREDVLAVGLAGALVRRDVWDELRGTDPALGPYGDGLDLCRRARLAGHRVVVVPAAVVRHAQASLAVPVAGAVLNRPGWDARRSAQARREAYLHGELVGVPALLVPVVAVLAVLSGVGRALVRLVTKEPHLVVAELLAPWGVLLRPGRVARARRNAARTRRVRRSSLRPLEVTWREVVRQERDRRLAAAELRRIRRAPSELEAAELAALRSRRRLVLTAVLTIAAVLTAVTMLPLLTGVLGGGRLVGGTLAGGDAGGRELWAVATAGWTTAGLGAAGAAEPLLGALLPATVLAGSLERVVMLAFVGALLLAATGAWFAAGAVTRSVGLRAWAALVWAAAPTLLVGLDQARLGGVLAHLALPWVVLGVARGVGAAGTDPLEPGARPRSLEPSLAAAAGAALVMALMTAAAPVLLPVGLLVLAGLALVVQRRRRLVWVAVPSLALHGPTIAGAVVGWSDGGWRALLADPGVPAAGEVAQPWQLLLGWPVDAPAWLDLPVDLSTGAATLVAAAATGVVALVALLALTRSGSAGRAARVGWWLVAAGTAAALLASAVRTGVADTGDVLVSPWHGPGLSLALAGLLIAALAGTDGLRGRLAGRSFGWRQVTAGLLTVAAVLGPVLVLGAWTVRTRAGSAELAVVQTPPVPAVGVQMQRSPDDVRVLSLGVDVTGAVTAELLREDGRQLTETARSTTARQVVGPWSGGAVRPPDDADQQLATTVAQLVTGTSPEVAAELARFGVGAVVVPALPAPEGSDDPAADEAPEGDPRARTELLGRIDATVGLERMTETESGVVWRVAVTELGTTAAWARLVQDDAGAAGALLTALPAQDGRVGTGIPTAEGPRLLVLAERADPGWRATLDGRPLRAVSSGWHQAFEVGPEAGHLVVTHVPAARTPWLVLQGTVLLVTVLLALPVRRRRGGVR